MRCARSNANAPRRRALCIAIDLAALPFVEGVLLFMAAVLRYLWTRFRYVCYTDAVPWFMQTTLSITGATASCMEAMLLFKEVVLLFMDAMLLFLVAMLLFMDAMLLFLAGMQPFKEAVLTRMGACGRVAHDPYQQVPLSSYASATACPVLTLAIVLCVVLYWHRLWCCVVSGTDIAIVLRGVRVGRRYFKVESAMRLRACYAMPGTDAAYVATSGMLLRDREDSSTLSMPPRVSSSYQPPSILRVRYAMSGTGIQYTATRHGPVLT
eukprot:603629-Rhodomonas_salina.2